MQHLDRHAAAIAMGGRVNRGHAADADDRIEAPFALEHDPHTRFGAFTDVVPQVHVARASNEKTNGSLRLVEAKRKVRGAEPQKALYAPGWRELPLNRGSRESSQPT